MTIDEICEALKSETCIKSYKIEKEKVDNATIFDSKFGGIPYWDFSKEFPTNNSGEKLNLLAQINFDKENFNNDNLPQKGILQFFISGDDDIYGIDFDKPDCQIGWRVVYHENVNYDVKEEDIANIGVTSFKDDFWSPFSNTYKITFKEVDSVINIEDTNFDSILLRILKEKFNVDIESGKLLDYLNEIDEKYYEKFSIWGHKLLGYPSFTQSDPRYDTYAKYDTLLLQIDSDGDDIMWGDCGVANFFINKEDLKNKDFSKILYNWDCC